MVPTYVYIRASGVMRFVDTQLDKPSANQLQQKYDLDHDGLGAPYRQELREAFEIVLTLA